MLNVAPNIHTKTRGIPAERQTFVQHASTRASAREQNIAKPGRAGDTVAVHVQRVPAATRRVTRRLSEDRGRAVNADPIDAPVRNSVRQGPEDDRPLPVKIRRRVNEEADARRPGSLLRRNQHPALIPLRATPQRYHRCPHSGVPNVCHKLDVRVLQRNPPFKQHPDLPIPNLEVNAAHQRVLEAANPRAARPKHADPIPVNAHASERRALAKPRTTTHAIAGSLIVHPNPRTIGPREAPDRDILVAESDRIDLMHSRSRSRGSNEAKPSQPASQKRKSAPGLHNDRVPRASVPEPSSYGPSADDPNRLVYDDASREGVATRWQLNATPRGRATRQGRVDLRANVGAREGVDALNSPGAPCPVAHRSRRRPAPRRVGALSERRGKSAQNQPDNQPESFRNASTHSE